MIGFGAVLFDSSIRQFFKDVQGWVAGDRDRRRNGPQYGGALSLPREPESPTLLCLALTVIVALLIGSYAHARGLGRVKEFPIVYPSASEAPASHHGMTHHGSTHEITYNAQGGDTLWLTGQNYDAVVEVSLDGRMRFYLMPTGSGPHGIEFDAAGQLWVTLEYKGAIVRLDADGNIATEYNVRLDCSTCPQEINTHPHGLAIGNDGMTVWYTGKGTGTVGKISPNGEVQTFALPTVGSVPIYIKAGPDGNMWVTELVGNMIARVTPDGEVTEFPIPTFNSRPIALVPEPGGQAMWFTEEAGHKLGRIDMQGQITEFPIPKPQESSLLAGLSFDDQRNIWVQQYIDQNHPAPPGPDHIVRVDQAILTAEPSDIPGIPITFFQVPTRKTVMHRIIQGPDGNMWFTEMQADKVGKLITAVPHP